MIVPLVNNNNVVNSNRVFLLKSLLIFNFPGKKLLFIASKEDLQEIKFPASNCQWIICGRLKVPSGVATLNQVYSLQCHSTWHV